MNEYIIYMILIFKLFIKINRTVFGKISVIAQPFLFFALFLS